MSSLYDELLIALHGVWNRRWLALGVAWAVCALGWLAVSLIPNSYQSKARLFIAPQSIIGDKVGITPADQQASLDAITQTLTSAANLARVVRGTDLAQTVSSDQDIAARAGMLRNHIQIVSTQDNLIEISATMADSALSDRANARIAAQVAQKLVDIFQEENIVGSRDQTKQGLNFLDQQLAATSKSLASIQQKRAEFERRTGLSAGDGSTGDRIGAARQELDQIETQLVAAQSGLAAMNGQMASTPATIAGPSAGPTALSQAEGELAAARARGWTAEHPDVIALQRQISNLKAQGGSRASGGMPNPAYQSLQSMRAERAATVQGLRMRKAQLESEIGAITAQQISDPQLSAELERMNHDYDVLKQQYDKLLSDREEVRLRGDAQSETMGSAFRLISPPSAPSAPTSPNRPLLLVGVLIVGIGAGVGAAFAMGQLRVTYPTVERLAKASGLPVIGAVSEMPTAAMLAERKRKLRLFAGGCGALAGVCLLLVVAEFVQRSLA